MIRFPICSFALVLLYPAGIGMCLVGLPRVAANLQASEAQLHIAFSIYLTGMATAMLLAGKIADQPGRKPVAIVGILVFISAPALHSFTESGTPLLIGRFIQGVGTGRCYVMTFAILRDMLDDRRRAKVLSLLNGITCIVPVLAPVIGHLIMFKHPWQSPFYTMMGMGIAIYLLSVFVLRESRPATLMATMGRNRATESLVSRFFLDHLTITTLNALVILTFMNTSPVLPMEVMSFDYGERATTIAMTAGISMAVSFPTPFALSVFKLRVLMPVLQVLFLRAGVVLALATSHAVILFGLMLIYAGFSVGFGVAMSRAPGLFSLHVGTASSALGIAQICGSPLWIWLAAVPDLDALNMLIGILIGCSIMSIILTTTVASNWSVPTHEEILQQS